jgi:hypothetical protein
MEEWRSRPFIVTLHRRPRLAVAAVCWAVGVAAIPLLLCSMLLTVHPHSQLPKMNYVLMLTTLAAWLLAVVLLLVDMLATHHWHSTRASLSMRSHAQPHARTRTSHPCASRRALHAVSPDNKYDVFVSHGLRSAIELGS